MPARSFFRITFIFLILCIVITVIVSGCQFPLIEVAGITATPITPSPSPRVCPPNIKLPKSDALKISRSYIVVLYDQADVETQVLEYEDKTKTSEAIKFVSKVLPRLLGSGDHYSIFRLGVRTYEAARVDRQSSEIQQAPDIPPAPELLSTLTPIPIIQKTYSVVLEKMKATNVYLSALDSHNLASTQVVFENNCLEMLYDRNFKETATQWGVTQQAKATEFSLKILNGKNETINRLNAVETPYSNLVVYEGLSHVTVDFKNECKLYDRCILILIDGLKDWRDEGNSYEKPKLEMDLKNVEVIAIMPSCTDIIQPSCTKIQDQWKPEFLHLGAKSVLFLNGDNLEKNLIRAKGGN